MTAILEAPALQIRASRPVQTACRRVLFISYPFPPVGGAGVQRTVKFVKYLAEHGWQASVLTVANPSVPVLDHSLAADIPAETVVRRARTLEPGYGVKATVAAAGDRRPGAAGRWARGLARRLARAVLQPDPQVLWLPGAVRAGRRLLEEIPHDAIIATAPPFSTFLVGAALSRRTGLPLVLDYRDEWDLVSAHWENACPGPVARWLQERMHRRVARSARALVATTQASARSLEAVRARAGADAAVTWIYNGFDPADFPAADFAEPPAGPRFRLAYVGTLYNLTSAAPLVAAVRELAARWPHLATGLELVFAGRRTPAQEQVLDGLHGLPCRVFRLPYVDHREAAGLLRSASGLCVLLADVPGAERVMPAKVFEYLAARRPVLAVAPRGELWDVLEGRPEARRFVPGDVRGIADWLARAVERQRRGITGGGGHDCSRYDRRHQAGELAALLDSVCGGRPCSD